MYRYAVLGLKEAMFRRCSGTLLASLLLAWLACAAQAAVTDGYYVSTGQAGAQTQIDKNHTSSFTIQSPADILFTGGLFTMKYGSSTSAPITFTLYDSAAKTQQLGSVTYTPAQFCAAQTGNCQSFAPTSFPLAAPVQMKAGKTYFAELTSSAPDAQSVAYFIKGAQSCSVAQPNGSKSSASCSYSLADTSGKAEPPASLRISKQGPDTATAGTPFTYSISVANGGLGAAGSATIKDQLPAGLTYNSYAGTGWSCSASGTPALLTCTYQSAIAGGARSAPLTINVTPAASPDSFENWASVDPTGGGLPSAPGASTCSQADLDSGVCAQTVTALTSPTDPYLTVAISDPSPVPDPGEEVTYTVTIENEGGGEPPPDTPVYVDLPEEAIYDDGRTDDENPDWDCETSGGGAADMVCNWVGDPSDPEDPPGNIEVLKVIVDIPEDVEEGTSFDAEVFVDRDGDPIDPVPAACIPSAELACSESEWTLGLDGYTITKSQPVPPLAVGKRSVYTLSVSTTGTAVSTDVKDQLPVGMRLISVSSTGNSWQCSTSPANLILCNKVISSGSPEEIFVEVEVEPQINANTLTNYASVGAEGAAPEPGAECDSPDYCAISRSTVEDIREKIAEAVEDDVQAFMESRLDRIVSTLDQPSRLRQFRQTACGISKDLSLNGEATSSAANLSGSGNFSMKGGGIVPTADAVVPEQCGTYNIWSEMAVSHVDGEDGAASNTALATVGVEFLLSDSLLTGLRLSFDYTDASFDGLSDANSDISGFGWFAGPYFSAEIASNLFLDGFIGYGTSWNDYQGDFEGLDLEGDFETQRILGNVNLNGEFDTGSLILSPLAGIAYAREWNGSFDVSNAEVGDTRIAEQTVELGRLTARLEAAYPLVEDSDQSLQIFAAPNLSYDFLRTGDEVDALLGESALRGGLDGGLRYSQGRFGASLLLGYEGIGAADWRAYTGALEVNYAW